MKSIEDFYSNQSIFLTGCTGYIGKAVVEKLLRSFPKLTTIYLLCREKKGISASERIEDILEDPLFDRLKKTSTSWRNKMVVIPGDVSQLNLGISQENKELLKRNVSIIVHAAASVEFHGTFKDTLLTNTRGTREICKLALEMPNVKCFVHTSTAYSNSNRTTIDEILYSPPFDWKKAIKIAEEIDDNQMAIITKKFLDKFLNTYTLSKVLAEHVVNDICVRKIPTFIIRPSIVLSAVYEPISGWVDNFNGPVGVCVAAGKGLIKTYLANDSKMNLIPIDFLIKIILMIPYYELEISKKSTANDLKIYNACVKPEDTLTVKDFSLAYLKVSREYPLKQPLGYPSVWFTCSKSLYYLYTWMYHLIPAILVDFFLRIFGKKPFLIRLQRKIYVSAELLLPFIMRNWQFLTGNLLNLQKFSNENYNDDFTINYDNFHTYDYMKKNLFYLKRYLLKEPMDFVKDRRYLLIMKIFSVTINVILGTWMIYMIWKLM